MTKIADIRRSVIDLMNDHAADPDGLPTTIRFVFYELEQRGLARKPSRLGQRREPGWPPGSSDITDAITQLREEGVIPWGWFVDTERSLSVWTHAPSVREYLLDRLPEATINPWLPGPAPLILTESNGMAQVLERVAGEYSADIAGTKGMSNGFIRTRIAPVAGMSVTSRDVLYLGDLDRSGMDIEANSERVLRDTGWTGDWDRIGLLPSQTAGLTPMYKTDRRDGKVAVAYEVESLGQSNVVALVRAALDARLPQPLADIALREEAERKEVAARLAA